MRSKNLRLGMGVPDIGGMLVLFIIFGGLIGIGAWELGKFVWNHLHISWGL